MNVREPSATDVIRTVTIVTINSRSVCVAVWLPVGLYRNGKEMKPLSETDFNAWMMELFIYYLSFYIENA